MSTPPLPAGVADTVRHRVANRLHSIAIHLLRRARREDRATGLSPERLSLLSVVVFAGPRRAGELAEIEMVARPAVTRTVNALEEQGLVRRRSSPKDGRGVLVCATAKGRKLLEGARRRRIERIAGELARLSSADLADVERAARVLQALEGGRGGAIPAEGRPGGPQTL